MTRTAEANLKLTAQDKTAKAFASVSGNFRKVSKAAGQYNKQMSGMNRMVTGARKTIIGAQKDLLRMFGPAAVAYGMKRAVVGAAEFERALQRMVIMGEATDEQIVQIGETIRDVAHEAFLPVENVRAGFESLLNAGKPVEEALQLIRATSIAAQAADADAADLATSIIAVSDNLKIAAGDAEAAFDIMIKGGKAGKFELKDMAQYLPGLAPMFANLGYRGEEGLAKLVALMQTVRLQTGESSQAATALSDLFQKMEVDTVQNKFKKFGVDVRKSMAAARREGRDLLDTFIDLAREASGGDLSKLPQLIPDKEMRRAVNAILTNQPALKRFTAEVGNATGEASRDLARLADDTQASLDKMANSWDRFSTNIGAIIAKGLVPAMDVTSELIESFAIGGHKNPKIAAALGGDFSKLSLSPSEISAFRKEYEALSKMIAADRKRAAGGDSRASMMLPDSEAVLADYKRVLDRIDKFSRAAPPAAAPKPSTPKKRGPLEVLPMPRPAGGGVDRISGAFDRFEKNIETDMSDAGTAAMAGFTAGLDAEGQKAIRAAAEIRRKIQNELAVPIRGPAIIPSSGGGGWGGVRANTGQSMPGINEPTP